jgi:hypothetical protein
MVRKCAVVCGLVLALLMPGAAGAATCTKTWIAGVGYWGVASNWSPAGVPTSSDSVCITNPGTYTVTMAPTDSGSVASLTLGAPTPGGGTQTLSVVGQSNLSGSTTVHQTTLTLSSGGAITQSGELILDATGQGTTNDGLTGGNAELDPGTLTNAGQIVTQVEDTQWGTTLGAGTITNTGTIDDASGALTTTATTINEGAMAVGTGATDSLGASFANAGTFANGGITTIQQQGATPIAWAQAGPAYGNPVELREGATLVDSAGAGAFVFDIVGGGIIGTIPAGQTVTVRGEANDTTVSLGNGTAPVINRGDLILEAPGSGTSSGGATHLTGGALLNYGRIVTTVEDPSWANYLQVPLTNETGGLADVSSGVLHDTAAVANYGTAEVAPSAQWALDSGSSLVNESNGELEPDVAGPSSYGTIDLTGGTLTAGGTLAPFQVEGYVPAANAEFRVVALSGGTFSGIFSKVLAGFTADYSHESSTPAFVGAIYHKSSISPPPPPKKTVLRVGPVKGGVGVVTVALSCSGSGTCAAATIVVTAKHGRVVARGGATLKAGKSRTVALKINTRHSEKVTVTVSALGKRLTYKNVSVSAKK